MISVLVENKRGSTMNSKNFLKSTGSALILGSSLASLVGQQSVNANLLGSIKNFFFGDETKNEEKKLSLKERKDKYNKVRYKEVPPGSAAFTIFAQLSMGTVLSILVGGCAAFAAEDAYVTKNHINNYWDHYKEIKHVANTTYDKVFKWGLIITALTVVGFGVHFYIKQKTDQKNAKKDFTELKKSISGDMLEKQWALEKFQEMLENKNNCKIFLEQLLVLEPSSSENKEEKVQAFKELFTKEPEELKNIKDNGKKEIYKELITNLSDWCSGEMKRLYDPGKETEYEKNYFIAQDDIELASKIILLRKIVLGEKVDYQRKITNLAEEDFNKNIKDESKKNFRKLLVFDIRNYISEQDANDETIINILTELTEPNEVGQPIDYYRKIKTFFEDEFKDKQKQNRVLLGLKNFFKEERLYNRGFKYVFKEAYESFKRVER